jgi:hypothetical protein
LNAVTALSKTAQALIEMLEPVLLADHVQHSEKRKAQ